MVLFEIFIKYSLVQVGRTAGKCGEKECPVFRRNVIRGDIEAVAYVIHIGVYPDAVHDILGKQYKTVRR